MSLAHKIQLAFLEAIKTKSVWHKDDVIALYIETVNTILIEELNKKENTNASS